MSEYISIGRESKSNKQTQPHEDLNSNNNNNKISGFNIIGFHRLNAWSDILDFVFCVINDFG